MTRRDPSEVGGVDPDGLLDRFRSALREIEQLTADYHADPDNELDPSATATYVDRKADLLADAVDAAAGLDTAACGGEHPHLWNHTHTP